MQLNPLNVRATSLNMPEQASRSSEQIRVREAGSLQTTRGNQRNCNLSFLVKKKSNSGYHLVTCFADVGRHCKCQPSLMPDVDATLRQIPQWKHIVTTDITSAFYQIPLAHETLQHNHSLPWGPALCLFSDGYGR